RLCARADALEEEAVVVVRRMERVVSQERRIGRGWAQTGGAAPAGGNLQPGRRAARGRADQRAAAAFRPGESGVPGATGERDCADQYERVRPLPADDFLSVRVGFAICARRGVAAVGGIADV